MNTIVVEALARGPELKVFEVVRFLRGVGEEAEGDGVVEEGRWVGGFGGFKGGEEDAFAGTQAGVVGTFAGLECLGYQLFVGFIGFVLTKEDGGGEGFEEKAKEFVGDSVGQRERGKVSEPGQGGVPGGLGFSGWAGVVKGK